MLMSQFITQNERERERKTPFIRAMDLKMMARHHRKSDREKQKTRTCQLQWSLGN